MTKPLLFVIATILTFPQTFYAQAAPETFSSAVQSAGTISRANNSQRVYFADQYCKVAGTLDETCLSNAIAAGGDNSTIVIPPGIYYFSSRVIAKSLTNVEIVGSGDSSVIKSNGTAFECDNCTGGGIANVNFTSSITPVVITCSLDPASRQMSCPGLPTRDPSEVITLDPWQQRTGHIPTETDNCLFPEYHRACKPPPHSTPLLSSTQTSENFDSGVFYYKPSSVRIQQITGSYNHIVLMDAINTTVENNSISGGNGAADTSRSETPSHRCGGICLWFSSNQAPGWFSNVNNSITNNTVNFPASEGIAIYNASGTIIANNQVHYGGESGILIGQGLTSATVKPMASVTSGSSTVTGISSTSRLALGQRVVGPYIPRDTTIESVGSTSFVMSNAATASSTEELNIYNPSSISYFAARTTITGNNVSNMDFDGIDASTDAPHSNRVSAYLTASGNVSCYNFGTGIYGDGLYATVTGNIACNNESFGMLFDNANSSITGNIAIDNNLQKNKEAAQIAIGYSPLTVNGGNTVVGNHAFISSGSGINGTGILTNNQGGSVNVLDGNYTLGGLPDSNTGYVTSAITTNSPAATISGAAIDSRVQTVVGLPAGSYSPILHTHDALIFSDINGTIDTGAIVVAAHSAEPTGVRIDGAQNILELWGKTIKANGQSGKTRVISLPCGTAIFTDGLLTGTTGSC